MAKIKKFEDIESWKSARKLAKQIYEITAAGEFTRDFGLRTKYVARQYQLSRI